MNSVIQNGLIFNNWSYHYARRQWHLVDDPNLKYKFLAHFDHDMVVLAKRFRLLESPYAHHLYEHVKDKVIAFKGSGLLFAFNFHPTCFPLYMDYCLDAPAGEYRMIFNSDAYQYGGHDRLEPDQTHYTLTENGSNWERNLLKLYLPTRTAIVLQLVSG